MESSVRARTREGACIAATLSAAAIVLRRDGQPYCPHATVLAPLAAPRSASRPTMTPTLWGRHRWT